MTSLDSFPNSLIHFSPKILRGNEYCIAIRNIGIDWVNSRSGVIRVGGGGEGYWTMGHARNYGINNYAFYR